MSIFGKKKNDPVYEEPVVETQEPVVEPEPQPKRPEEPKMPQNLTVIGVGTVFVGDITTNDCIEINGTVKGNIQSTSALNISGTGLLFGKADVSSLTVDGSVEGEVNCSGMTHITDKGSVKGTLLSASLSTSDGAVIDGTVKLGAAATPKKAAEEEQKTVQVTADEPTQAEQVTDEPKAQSSESGTAAAEAGAQTAADPQDGPVSVDELFS